MNKHLLHFSLRFIAPQSTDLRFLWVVHYEELLTWLDEVRAEDLEEHVGPRGQLQQEGHCGHLHHLTVRLHAFLRNKQQSVSISTL